MFILSCILGILTCIPLANGRDICGQCLCVPDTHDVKILLCEGPHVYTFPSLPIRIKNTIREILIIHTLIRCMYPPREGEFPLLKDFGERDNELWQCTCLSQWIITYPNTTFQSSCQYTSTIPPTLLSSTQSHNSSKNITTPTLHSQTFTTQSSIIPQNVTSVYHNSTSSTVKFGVSALSLSVVGLITIFIIVISILVRMHCLKRKGRCGIRTNRLVPLSFTNPIYRGCEIELSENVGGVSGVNEL